MKPISTILISGPSGVGKSSILQLLSKDYEIIKSYTTRQPRTLNENNYYFISHSEFHNKIQQLFFFEYNKVFDNYYGMSKEDLLSNNIQICAPDVEGAIKLSSQIPCFSLLILPPSIKELIHRRAQRDNKLCTKRTTRIKKELEFKPDCYIINNSLDKCAEQIKSIIKSIQQNQYNKIIEQLNQDGSLLISKLLDQLEQINS